MLKHKIKKIKTMGYKKISFLSSVMEENIKKYAFKHGKSNFHAMEHVSSTINFKQVPC